MRLDWFSRPDESVAFNFQILQQLALRLPIQCTAQTTWTVHSIVTCIIQ